MWAQKERRKAAVADEGASRWGWRGGKIRWYVARKLNQKKLPMLGPDKQTRLWVLKKKSTFIYRTYATSLPLYKPFSYCCNKCLKSRSPQHWHLPTHHTCNS